MSHLHPSPGTPQWPSIRSGVIQGQSVSMQNFTYQLPTFARDNGSQAMAGASSLQPSHHMSIHRQRSSTNGLPLPSSVSTTSPVSATTEMPAAPTYGWGSRGGSEHFHPHTQKPQSRSNLSLEELLNVVTEAFDNVVRGRLSAFEVWMKDCVENQRRANASFVNEVNTKLAEEQSTVSKKLDDHAQNYRQKHGELMQILQLNLSAWQETLVDQLKAAMVIGDEAVKKRELKTNDKLEQRSLEQRNAIEVIGKEVQMSKLEMQSRIDSLDARMKSIADILCSTASSLAASKSTTSRPAATAPPTSGGTASMAVTTSPTTPSSVVVRTSIVPPELLASSFTSFQTKLNECMSHAEAMIARLAEKTDITREEAHVGMKELANMVDVSHDLQTEQMALLHEEISALKAAVGVHSPATPTAKGELTRSSELLVSETSETSLSPDTPSLAERVQILEAKHQKLMQHLSNSFGPGKSYERFINCVLPCILDQTLPLTASLPSDDPASAFQTHKGTIIYSLSVHSCAYAHSELCVRQYLTLFLYQDDVTANVNIMGSEVALDEPMDRDRVRPLTECA